TKFLVLAPVVRSRKGEFVDLFTDLQTKGFSRAIVDGEQISLTEPPTLEKQYKHTISVVVDRLVAKPGMRPRLTDSVETALGLAEAASTSTSSTRAGPAPSPSTCRVRTSIR